MREEEPALGGPLGPLAVLRKIIPYERGGGERPARVGGPRGGALPHSARLRSQPARHTAPPVRPFCPAAGRPGPALRRREAAHAAPRRIDLAGAGRQPGPVALERAVRLGPHRPRAGVGRAGRHPDVRRRPGPADGPAARWPGPPAGPGRDVGGRCRTDGRRCRGAARRRVAGQRPGRPFDPTRPVAPPASRRRDGALPRSRLRAVVEYIEEHLDVSPTLEQIAAVARLSPYHFARQFKTATGLPPHKYVIARRVERAKQVLQRGSDFSLRRSPPMLASRTRASSPITSSALSA